jgi:hypothetical protein
VEDIAMKPARITCVVIALLALTAMPVLAGPKDKDPKPPPERQVRRVSFDDHAQAERFFHAFNLVLECRGKRPGLDVTLKGNVVELAGPPKLVRSAATLMGLPDQPQKDKQGKQEHKQKPEAQKKQHDLEELRAQALDAYCEHHGHHLEEALEHARERRREAEEERRVDAEREEKRDQDRRQEAQRDQAPRRQREPELVVRVFALEFADATHLVKFVDMLREGRKALWVVECDERTNSIVAKGPPHLVDEAQRLIDQLDQPGRGECHEPVMKLMPLTHANARDLAKVVSRIRDRAMPHTTVVPDSRTNTLVLAGPPDQVTRASLLIQSLDVKTKPAAKEKDEGKGKPAAEDKKGPKHKDKGKKADAQTKKGKQKGEANRPKPTPKPNPAPPTPPAPPTDV